MSSSQFSVLKCITNDISNWIDLLIFKIVLIFFLHNKCSGHVTSKTIVFARFTRNNYQNIEAALCGSYFLSSELCHYGLVARFLHHR